MGTCGRFMEVTPGEGSAHQPTIPIAVLSPRNSHMPKANLCTVHLCLKAGRFRPSPKRLFDLKSREERLQSFNIDQSTIDEDGIALLPGSEHDASAVSTVTANANDVRIADLGGQLSFPLFLSGNISQKFGMGGLSSLCIGNGGFGGLGLLFPGTLGSQTGSLSFLQSFTETGLLFAGDPGGFQPLGIQAGALGDLLLLLPDVDPTLEDIDRTRLYGTITLAAACDLVTSAEKVSIDSVATTQERLFLGLTEGFKLVVQITQVLDQGAQHESIGIGGDILRHVRHLAEQLV